MIVLYGASGYTGKLVAAELAGRGAEFVVAGRDHAKLDAVVRDLGAGSRPEVRVADVADPDGLARMLDGADVLLSTVGPFERLGMPVVDAAVAAGVAYCDSTGEPGFMRRVSRRHADAAVPVVPACGFDYVPHDLAAAVAAEGLDRVTTVETLLAPRRFATSRGTKASALGAMGDAGEEWDGGRWVPARAGSHRRSFPRGPHRSALVGVSYPGGEPVQIVNHVDAGTVRSYFVVPAALAGVAGPVAKLTQGVLAGRWVRDRLQALVDRSPEGPSAAARARNTWTVIAVASSGDEAQVAVATGTDVYGLTARLLAELALRIETWRDAGVSPGFRAPAEIVADPIAFASDLGFELGRVT